MSEDQSNNVILERIASLHDLTEEKFKGTYFRLDKLNGQVKKNTDFRQRQMGAYRLGAILCACFVGIVGIWKVFF